MVQPALALGILLAMSNAALTQQPNEAAQPTTLDRTLATLHGVVRNAATGEVLTRALVRVEGDADTGALTDAEGRFEIPNIPVGPQSVSVEKPGFLDYSSAAAGGGNGARTILVPVAAGNHNVMVAAEMPDVVFALAPTGAIRGQVELSTGDAAEGISVGLAKRDVENGRVVWQARRGTKTRSDGTFRFGELPEGEYAVYSEPAMDSDVDGTPGGMGQRWGYRSVYYPDAREPSGAAKIEVTSGQETQVNMTLTLEPFQTVTATVIGLQGSGGERGGMNLSASVLDSAGHQLLYPAQYDERSHAVQAELPDGNYTLVVSSREQTEHRGGAGSRSTGILAGSVDVNVAGRPVPNLRVALSAERASPIQVIVERNGTSPISTGPISVLVNQAGGWIDDGMMSSFADGTIPGPLESVYTGPGAYWVHTHNQRGLCVASFTAGGANLAREPLAIGVSGVATPMELTVRDDCAGLQLSLPENLGSITAGDEPFYTVFAVPDFDSTVDAEPVTLRPSTGGTATLADLTPGNYHVYTFAGSVQLAYRDSEALASLHGQAVTLSPGETSNLVLEAPGP
jgi:hypothetical protein